WRKPDEEGKLITSSAVSSWNGHASARPSNGRGGFDGPCRRGDGLVSATGRGDCCTTRADRLLAGRIRELHARVERRRKSAGQRGALPWTPVWQFLLCRSGRGWSNDLSGGRRKLSDTLSYDGGKVPATR